MSSSAEGCGGKVDAFSLTRERLRSLFNSNSAFSGPTYIDEISPKNRRDEVFARHSGRQDAVIAMKRYREIIEEHLERRILSLFNLPPCNVVVLRTKSEFARAADR